MDGQSTLTVAEGYKHCDKEDAHAFWLHLCRAVSSVFLRSIRTMSQPNDSTIIPFAERHWWKEAIVYQVC